MEIEITGELGRILNEAWQKLANGSGGTPTDPFLRKFAEAAANADAFDDPVPGIRELFDDAIIDEMSPGSIGPEGKPLVAGPQSVERYVFDMGKNKDEGGKVLRALINRAKDARLIPEDFDFDTEFNRQVGKNAKYKGKLPKNLLSEAMTGKQLDVDEVISKAIERAGWDPEDLNVGGNRPVTAQVRDMMQPEFKKRLAKLEMQGVGMDTEEFATQLSREADRAVEKLAVNVSKPERSRALGPSLLDESGAPKGTIEAMHGPTRADMPVDDRPTLGPGRKEQLQAIKDRRAAARAVADAEEAKVLAAVPEGAQPPPSNPRRLLEPAVEELQLKDLPITESEEAFEAGKLAPKKLPDSTKLVRQLVGQDALDDYVKVTTGKMSAADFNLAHGAVLDDAVRQLESLGVLQGPSGARAGMGVAASRVKSAMPHEALGIMLSELPEDPAAGRAVNRYARTTGANLDAPVPENAGLPTKGDIKAERKINKILGQADDTADVADDVITRSAPRMDDSVAGAFAAADDIDAGLHRNPLLNDLMVEGAPEANRAALARPVVPEGLPPGIKVPNGMSGTKGALLDQVDEVIPASGPASNADDVLARAGDLLGETRGGGATTGSGAAKAASGAASLTDDVFAVGPAAALAAAPEGAALGAGKAGITTGSAAAGAADDAAKAAARIAEIRNTFDWVPKGGQKAFANLADDAAREAAMVAGRPSFTGLIRNAGKSGALLKELGDLGGMAGKVGRIAPTATKLGVAALPDLAVEAGIAALDRDASQDEDWTAGLKGAARGAAIGGGLGSFAGAPGIAIGAGLGGLAGGAYGFLKNPDPVERVTLSDQLEPIIRGSKESGTDPRRLNALMAQYQPAFSEVRRTARDWNDMTREEKETLNAQITALGEELASQYATFAGVPAPIQNYNLPMEDYAQLFGQVTGDMGGLIGQAPVSERAGLLKSLMMMPQMAQAELMGSGYYPQQPTPTGLGYDVMQAPTPMPMGGGGLAGGLDSEALTQIAMGMA